MKTLTTLSTGCLLLTSLTGSTLVLADAEIEAAAQIFADQSVSRWLGDPVIISAIRTQNTEHANLQQAEIDSLDQQWRAETESGASPLITKVTSNDLSKFLKDVKDSDEGLVTEIFIMDNKGLNVGQSDITSDFWQGDEAKWQKTYQAAPKAMFVDEVEMDDSTQRFQTQISIAITDPDTGENIGAVTIGVDAEGLLMQ